MYDWVIQLIDWGGYVGVFLLMLLETMFPPIPSEVVLPLAGMRAAQGPLGLAGVIVFATAGAMLGNFLWYLLARAIRPGALPPLHRPARPLADDGLARRREGRRAISSGMARASSSSGGCCRRCAPSSPSRRASLRMPVARYPALVDARHRDLERGAGRRRLCARRRLRADRGDRGAAHHRHHRRSSSLWYHLAPAHLEAGATR